MACNEPLASRSTTNGRAAASGGTRRGQRQSLLSTLVFDLCDEQPFQATSPVASALFDEYVLTDEEFEGLGPSLVDLIVHAEGTNFTANFSYDVVLQYKFRNGAWTTVATSLVALQTATTYVIGSTYSDRAKFGMRIRLVLRTQIVTGTSNPQHGALTVSVAARLYTGT
jgi:hypothetical protein